MAGPIGSAKTTGAAVAEAFFTGITQKPMNDGVRRAKVGILRDTYRNLYSTLIPTWFRWVPKDVGKFVGSDDRPAVHEISFDAPFVDGTRGLGRVELRVEMRALGNNNVEETCRGWELTGCYLDEMDLFPEEALSFLAGRVMRYPDKPFRVSRGVWGTFNKPDEDHWLYRKCVEEADLHEQDDFGFFDQPGGLLPGGPPYRVNPAAENLANLDDDYYPRAAKGQPEWYIRRMLRNEWGASVSGELIYPEFRTELHMAPGELEPLPGQELTLGVDGGGTPAAVVMGRDVLGRRIIYAEVVLADPSDPRGRRLLTGVGPTRFEQALRDALFPRFNANPIKVAYADPSMFYGADREMGEYADIETIGQRLKIPVTPAPSNEIAIRLEAVRGPLISLGRDGRPQLVINPSCKWVRRGFASDYKWEERNPKQPGARLKPQKSATSHVHDALQYALLGDTGRAGVTGGPAYDRWQAKETTRPGEEGWMPEAIRAERRAQGGGYRGDFNVWDS